MDLKARAKKLKTDVPAVFLALKDRRAPWYAKIIAAIVVVYALSPVDLVPDFIPVLGPARTDSFVHSVHPKGNL